MPDTPLARTILAATACALLAGCGLKGPLYIPDTPAAAQRSTLPELIFRTEPRDGPGKQQETPAAAAAQPHDEKP